MATATRISLEHYLSSSEWEPDADFVDEELQERPMGEDGHAAWQGAILEWFQAHRREWGIRVLPELRIQVLPRNFQVPDVAVLDRAHPRERIPTRPPLAVFEVLSPEDRVQRVTKKLMRYQVMGVPAIYQVDPETGSWSRFEDGQLVRTTQFFLPARGITFELAQIAALVD